MSDFGTRVGLLKPRWAGANLTGRQSGLRQRLFKARYIYLLLLPGLVYYLFFHYLPMYGILMAFKNFNANLGIWGSHWAGLTHFEYIFSDPSFLRAFRNTLFISMGRILFELPFPILLALLINELREGRSRRILQTLFTFPHFLSWVIIGSIMLNLFGDQGIVNMMLSSVGLGKIRIFSSSDLFRPFLFFSNIWKESGWSSIIYLAAIASIDIEQYESAAIDGITRRQKMWYITLPNILPTVVILFILAVGNAMNAGFDQVFNLYNGAVLDMGDIIDTYIYRITFQGPTDFSFSTAVGLFKSLINFALLIAADFASRRLSGKGLFH